MDDFHARALKSLRAAQTGGDAGDSGLSPELADYYNGYADGSYEADHDDAAITDEQLAQCGEAYAKGYRKGYDGDPFDPEGLAILETSDESEEEAAR